MRTAIAMKVELVVAVVYEPGRTAIEIRVELVDPARAEELEVKLEDLQGT
jgi:hypothetical protein